MIWKFINWLISAIGLIVNPPCDECGYQGCEACTDEVEDDSSLS